MSVNDTQLELNYGDQHDQTQTVEECMNRDCARVANSADDRVNSSYELSFEEYRYSSFPTSGYVRTLTLLPGIESEPIVCKLRSAKLDDVPPFEALSYVWGDARDMMSIYCFDDTGKNSESTASALLVTVNCWHSLLRLRLKDKARKLWVDAICINQKDEIEKSHQVPLMGSLYRKAACVIVYLGYDANSARICKVFTLFKNLEMKITSFPKGVTAPTAFEGLEKSTIISFRKFFDQAWFKRCWTLQEIGLARRAKLVCDGDELEWDAFFSVICWINKYQPLDRIHLDLPTQELETAVRLYTTFETREASTLRNRVDFLDVLNSTRNRQCTDPRDRIYAFLGHATASTEEGPLVVPDYLRTDWVVFYGFAISYLKNIQNLRILSAVNHGKVILPHRFPLSWIPWWNGCNTLCNFGLSSLYRASAGAEQSQNIGLGGTPLAELDLDKLLDNSPLFEWDQLMIPSTASNKDLYLAARRAMQNINSWQTSKIMNNTSEALCAPESLLQPERAKLSVRGLVLDEIKLACPTLYKEDFAMQSFSKERKPSDHSVERLCDAIQEKRFPSLYEDSLLALSLTLVGGMHGSVLVKDIDDHKASFESYRKTIQNFRVPLFTNEEWAEARDSDAPLENVPHGTNDDLWKEFMVDASQACHGRRFFPTVSGYFGLGPAAMGGENLFCCIIFGASVPFILQKHESIYRLVGEAYVHGIMNGEAIEMWKRGELEEVDFTLF